MTGSNNIETRIQRRISRKWTNVLIREDFIDLGGYDQIGRALLQLTRKGVIVKIGYGLYAKTTTSSLTGERILIKPLPVLAKEALKRLGVKLIPTTAELDYQTGKSTQVPTGRLIGVKGRVNRKIAYKGTSISYERSAQ